MKLRASIGGTVAVALTALVCGTASASTQGISGKTITIGSSAILSGPYVAYSQIAAGLNAYLKYVNSTGGVAGYKFKVVQEDNQYTAAQSVAVARQEVFQDKAFMFTLAGTTPTQAIIPLASQLKVPVLFVANADLVKHTTANLFGEEPSFTRLSLFDSSYIMKTLGIKKIAYAYENDDIGQPPLGKLPGYVKSHGGNLVTKVGFAATVTNFNSYANQLKASGAKAVLVFAGPTSVAGLQKAATAIGYHPKWFALFASVTPAYVQLAGKSVADGTYFDNFFELSNANTASAKLFAKKVGAANVGLLGELGWTDGALIAAGVKGAAATGHVTDQSFEKALTKLTKKSVGVWPDVTFTAASHSGATSADVLEVKNGKFVQVAPFEPLPAIP